MLFRSDNSSRERQNEFTFDANGFRSLFTNLYATVNRSNSVLDNIQPESDIKKRAIAEAKVFRGLSYLYLVSFWGTPPLVLKVLPNQSEYAQPNGNTAEIWAQIETDFTEAINSGYLIEKKSLDDKTQGYRVTKHAAQAFLGKAYVFQKKWSEACSIFDEIINSGLYGLYEGEYENIMRTVADNCRETILEINYVRDLANPSNSNFIGIFSQGWRHDKMSLNDGYGISHDLMPNGNGFFSPTKDLYDAFVAREGVDGYRLNSTIKTYEQVKAISTEHPITINEGTYLYGHEGYFFWKHRLVGSESIPGVNQCFESNVKVMRYAEVLLLAAEAHIQGGNADKAKTYINEIRTRAKLPELGSVTMDDVKIEKRLELCHEGIRFNDLIRWGDAAETLKNQGEKIPVFYYDSRVEYPYTNTQYGFKVGKHELLPFPQDEIAVNLNLKQNPGW